MNWQLFLNWLHHTVIILSAQFSNSDEGQGLVEYALILTMVSVAAVAVATVLGPGIGNIYSNIMSSIHGTGP